ncbi:MAG: type II CRISPR RNA-guided endonuclease Cas9, partial [Acidobacteriota bacterium]
LQALFDQPRFEIEHIIPFSRSLDNTFLNKTLCRNDYNRQKGKQTPWEVFGGTDQWDQMVERIRKMGNRRKLALFQMTESGEDKLLEDFTARQLTDTKYASKLAAQYVGTLFGGVVDAAGTRRVVTCAGEVTAHLRRAWNLNRILSETPEKSRDDHRHHAVDAVAIALASHKWIKALSDFSKTSLSRRPLANAVIPDPWPGFREEVHAQILERTIVSHRPEKKLHGALHEETIYGKPHIENGKQIVHVRKPVTSLTTRAAIEDIVDPAVQDAVMRHFGFCGEDARKFAENPPCLPSGVPIKSARIRKSLATVTVGAGVRQRAVATGDNHHMEVVAELDKDGKPKRYRGIVVSRLEALRRFRRREPVIQKSHGPGFEFCFTLREGDMVEYAPDGALKELWRVRGVTVQANGSVILSRASDARLKKELAASDLPRPPANQFMKRGGRKVQVSPLGEVAQAHD